jgi:hypothetical protein
VEVTSDDSEEVDEDVFASSSEESAGVEEVAAARVDRIIGRTLCQIVAQGIGASVVKYFKTYLIFLEHTTETPRLYSGISL